MNRRKRKELEAARLAEEKRRKEEANRNADAASYYTGVSAGALHGVAIPICGDQIDAIQLPPIIQPISLIPSFTQGEVAKAPKNYDDDFDDFDDFD